MLLTECIYHCPAEDFSACLDMLLAAAMTGKQLRWFASEAKKQVVLLLVDPACTAAKPKPVGCRLVHRLYGSYAYAT